MIKLVGTISWGYPDDDGEVQRAILRENGEFVFDCTYEAQKFTVRLKHAGGNQYRGTFDAREGNESWVGKFDCRLYQSGDHYLAFGKWIDWGNEEYVCAVELTAVESFDK